MRLLWAVIAAVVLAGAAQAAPALEDYGRLPAVEEMTLSPSGEQLAMIAVVGENRRVVAMSVEGKARLVAPIGRLKVRDLEWAGEDHLLVAESRVVNLPFIFAAKYEMGTRIDLDLNSRAPLGVFAKDRGVYPAILRDYGVQEIDGRWYGFFGAISLTRDKDVSEVHLDHSYADLYRYDLQSGADRRIASGSELEHDWVVAPDGSVRAHSEYDRKSGAWRLQAGAFGGRVLMQRKAPLDEIDLVGFGRTLDSVLVYDGTGDTAVIDEQPLDGGAATPLFQNMKPEQYLYAAKSRLLLGARVEGPQGVVLFDPKLQARYRGARKALAGYEVRLVSYTDDFGRMILFADGGDDSGSYWLVDIATGHAKPLGSAYPTITAADVGPTRMVSYKAADGVALDGVLTLPPGKEGKKLPVVVMPHGGPIGPYDKVGFDWWAQAFASRGYAVFQPNYRGSGGHGRPFQISGYGQWGRKMQSDVTEGLAEIVREGVVDPKRACIVGASYGGYAAMAGITLEHGLYRCAVSYGGVSDLTAMLQTEAVNGGWQTDVMRFWRAAMGADKGDIGLDKLSPAKLANHADAPLLLIHGKDDTVVSPDQSTRMADAMKRAGKPVELTMLPGEDHWLSREETRIATLKASVAFVEKHNPAD